MSLQLALRRWVTTAEALAWLDFDLEAVRVRQLVDAGEIRAHVVGGMFGQWARIDIEQLGTFGLGELEAMCSVDAAIATLTSAGFIDLANTCRAERARMPWPPAGSPEGRAAR